MKSQSWEEEASDVVGNIISFWGFKENHGRIWSLLYLKQQNLSTSEIRLELKLSKGAASMLLQDLENWNILANLLASNFQDSVWGTLLGSNLSF